jgi:hypothetical protein
LNKYLVDIQRPKKRVVSEAAQQQQSGYFKGYRINHSGFGILQNISKDDIKTNEDLLYYIT